MSHKGAYICTAENEAGKDTRRIYLNVKCKSGRNKTMEQMSSVLRKHAFCVCEKQRRRSAAQ